MWFYILFEDEKGVRHWEVVNGEDAMQERVSELMDLLECGEEDIIVFNTEDEVE